MENPTFAELGVSEPVTSALAARGIMGPFAIQSLAIPDALTGRDVLAKSRTGSGKTLAFGIPMVERISPESKAPTALILVPTRELASQVHDEMKDVATARGLRIATVYGGVAMNAQAKAAARAHIIVATPGRMEDLASRKMVSLANISILVLDEADRMLDMGFLPQVDRLVKRIPTERQTMFFSATLDGAVGRLSRAFTRDAVLHEIATPRPTVEEADHRFVQVTDEGKVQALIDLLGEDRGHALVFVRTKRGADRLTMKLQSHSINAEAIHGDLSQAARERALERFDTGKINVLVATDVAARGLDVDHITHVVNYDPPGDDASYVHRVGRTARAGRTGTGVTFVLPDQRSDVSRMAARLSLHDEFEKGGMKVAPPRMVYTARRGRNSLLGKRPRRAF